MSSSKGLPRIALTPGEPAGIGPELLVKAALRDIPAQLIAVCDPALIEAAARILDVDITLVADDGLAHQSGTLAVVPVSMARAARPGFPDPENARYVLETLDIACDGCSSGKFDAMVTGPVQKSVINDAGIAFSGHTEYLAGRTGGYPVMMLATNGLRVALATTHLPLKAVPAAINRTLLERVIRIIDGDLKKRFSMDAPRIVVCGLNPHAGEGGHLGDEEIEIIKPVVDALLKDGLDLIGPLPADTAFTRHVLNDCDVVLAMYHDQGLPVIKHAGFGDIVNITLGLPIIRTSVDHGTALDLAGSGRGNADSLIRAIDSAIDLARANVR